MDHRRKCKILDYKTYWSKQSRKSIWPWVWWWFLIIQPTAWSVEEKKLSWNLLKLCSVKDTLKRIKRKVTHWEKISEKNTSDKRTDELYEGLKT